MGALGIYRAITLQTARSFTCDVLVEHITSIPAASHTLYIGQSLRTFQFLGKTMWLIENDNPVIPQRYSVYS